MEKIIINGVEIVEGLKLWNGEYYMEITEIMPENDMNWTTICFKEGKDGEGYEMNSLELEDNDLENLECLLLDDDLEDWRYEPDLNSSRYLNKNYQDYVNSVVVRLVTEVEPDEYNPIDGDEDTDEPFLFVNFEDWEGSEKPIQVLVNDQMFLATQICLYYQSISCINTTYIEEPIDSIGDVEILECALFNKAKLEDMIKEKYNLKEFTIK